MEPAKAIVKGKFEDYLNGQEVEARITDTSNMASVSEGRPVLVYKDALSAQTTVSVPKKQQSHYIGIEGTITRIVPLSDQRNDMLVLVVKR